MPAFAHRANSLEPHGEAYRLRSVSFCLWDGSGDIWVFEEGAASTYDETAKGPAYHQRSSSILLTPTNAFSHRHHDQRTATPLDNCQACANWPRQQHSRDSQFLHIYPAYFCSLQRTLRDLLTRFSRRKNLLSAPVIVGHHLSTFYATSTTWWYQTSTVVKLQEDKFRI